MIFPLSYPIILTKGEKMIEKYSKNYEIRSYEVDKDKRLRLLTLFNVLQDISDTHAEKIGVGYSFCVKEGLAWVGAGYHVKINRLPTWRDEVTITTWPSGNTAATAYRDSMISDEKGNPLVLVSSQWALIDVARLRPVALAKHIDMSLWRNDRAIDTNFPTLPLPERKDFDKTFYVRYDDIDVNNHVNNAVYPVWASEAVPFEFRKQHELAEIKVAFKRSAVLGDVINIETQRQDKQTRHLIKSAEGDRVYAIVDIDWREK